MEKTPKFPKKKPKTNENNSPNKTLNESLNSTFEITNNKQKTNEKNFFFRISDEERFSLLKINKIKNKKFSPYKTTSRLIKNYKNFDNNSNNKNYYNLLKKKKKSTVFKKNSLAKLNFLMMLRKPKKSSKFSEIAKSESMKIGKIINKSFSMTMISIPTMMKFKMEQICA